MKKTILVTGGLGFIGSNVCEYYLNKGYKVVALDNMSRKGVEVNLKRLKTNKNFSFIKEDVRNKKGLEDVIKKLSKSNLEILFHEAAQVAVTTSIKNPREDFEINILGTINVLEALRQFSPKTILVYASTNKVYGDLEEHKIIEKKARYEFKDKKLKFGISENQNLDFYSPYGCSKGSADQYVRDYARIYGLKTIVFRQSCIYGPGQIGVEDQGWVAWFAIRALKNEPLTIFGTGKQVRDLLFIDDLIKAYDLAIKNIKKTAGEIYNIGGGYKNAVSLLELIQFLEKYLNTKIKMNFSQARPGDQKIFISNNSKAKKDFNWEPKVDYKKGVPILIEWLRKNIV
jgi:CDP-paratose 2-epimerase